MAHFFKALARTIKVMTANPVAPAPKAPMHTHVNTLNRVIISVVKLQQQYPIVFSMQHISSEIDHALKIAVKDSAAENILHIAEVVVPEAVNNYMKRSGFSTLPELGSKEREDLEMYAGDRLRDAFTVPQYDFRASCFEQWIKYSSSRFNNSFN